MGDLVRFLLSLLSGAIVLYGAVEAPPIVKTLGAQAAMRDGARDFVPKPLASDLLDGVIQRLTIR